MVSVSCACGLGRLCIWSELAVVGYVCCVDMLCMLFGQDVHVVWLGGACVMVCLLFTSESAVCLLCVDSLSRRSMYKNKIQLQ